MLLEAAAMLPRRSARCMTTLPAVWVAMYGLDGVEADSAITSSTSRSRLETFPRM